MIKHGPFAWKKRQPAARPGEEVWELQPPATNMTHFVLKNYGGTPGPGFAGWKLVSGGPFDDAGAYDNLQSAIEGVTPYLITHYRTRAAEIIAEANTLIAACVNLTDTLDQNGIVK